MPDRLLYPSHYGSASHGDGELIFNREIVQMLIDWMDGKPRTYKECYEFLSGIFIARRMLIVDDRHIYLCLDRLDRFWRMDETQS
jgi:hypothetical protein